MRRAISIFAVSVALMACVARSARAQSCSYSSLPQGSSTGGERIVDGIAARIEDDILTESEVRELSAFQTLVDGKSKSRAEIIQELADQWILRGEAATAKYPMPSTEDVDRSYEEFAKQFSSSEEFQKRLASAGLSEAAVRRMLAQQLYLSRFIDYRFRPAAQIEDKQIQDYYDKEFSPQLKQRGEAVPPLEQVEDTIREVLIQRDINDRSAKWLDEARQRMNIDVISGGNSS
jgi:hypothetical protein